MSFKTDSYKKNTRRRIEERIRHHELEIEEIKKIILRYRKDLVCPMIMGYEIT